MSKPTRKPAPSVVAGPPITNAAPGSEGDAKAKKEKVVRGPFLKEGDPKLTADDPRLASYDWRTTKKPTPKDFVSKAEVLRWRANTLEASVKKMRTEADRIESLGTLVDNKKAKRLVALTAQMDELKKSLAAEGTDVNELLRSMGLLPAATDEAPAAE